MNNFLSQALWQLYYRPDPAEPWSKISDLFWSDPAFSERILREHLDDTHGAASRDNVERTVQIEWLWKKLRLQPQAHLFDITCGPGLYAVEFAQRGCTVTGNDFNPAAIAYAKDLAVTEGVTGQCTFIEQDIREMDYRGKDFDAAILLYGQLAPLPPAKAQALLVNIAQSLKQGGRLCLELLNQERVDKENNSWWFTDDSGLWGDGPFLHLGERFWYDDENISVERYYIIHLESGELTEMQMTDQTYGIDDMTTMLKEVGFNQIEAYPAWDGLPLNDAEEWVVYVAQK